MKFRQPACGGSNTSPQCVSVKGNIVTMNDDRVTDGSGGRMSGKYSEADNTITWDSGLVWEPFVEGAGFASCEECIDAGAPSRRCAQLFNYECPGFARS